MAGDVLPFPAGPGARVQTVTELTAGIRDLLEGEFPRLSVRGEISGFRVHTSGHAYFTLKDPGALINCVSWRSSLQRMRSRPVEADLLRRLDSSPDGVQVVIHGSIGVYPPRGAYQLYAERMEEAGRGDLHAAFLRLKAKLESEGLFDEERKRDLPEYPRRIGIVTSRDGAALRDMLRVLGSRWPLAEIVLRPAPVQGEGAAAELARAIAELNGLGAGDVGAAIDVIIIARGGGSLEDLWQFNEEVLARAVAKSGVPVISGVGHETDVTICDFAADLRAATPSNAAELAVPDRADVARMLEREARRLGAGVGRSLDRARVRLLEARHSRGLRRGEDLVRRRAQDLDRLADRLAEAVQASHRKGGDRLRGLESRLTRQEPRARVAGRRARLEELRQALVHSCENRLARRRAALGVASAQLRALGPDSVLARGYAVVRRVGDGALVRLAEEAPAGAEVDVMLHRGRLACRVETSEPAEAAGGDTVREDTA